MSNKSTPVVDVVSLAHSGLALLQQSPSLEQGASCAQPQVHFLKKEHKLSRGEICVANFIPLCKWCKSRKLVSQKLTFFVKKGQTKTALAPKRANFF